MSGCGMSDEKYLGKFRGTVVNNVDPLQIGRLQVMVPDVSNVIPTTWAMPCLPIAGMQMGMHAVPPVGAGVWVEFEQGDPDYPIWVGCWWGSVAEVPPLALAGLPASPNIVLQTSGQNSLVISDLPGPTGGFTLKTRSGAMLSVSDLGITISNGQAVITLIGPTVSINGTALVVT